MNLRQGIFGVLWLVNFVFFLSFAAVAQSPGGVSAGLTAWFKADVGVTMVGGTPSSWTNQVANPNLANVVRVGAASVFTSNVPMPFNFNPYIQFSSAGGFQKAASTSFDEVVKADAGSIFGVGTGASSLVSITSNFTTSPCGGNRCNSGTGYSGSEFGNTGPNWSPAGLINRRRANVWGLRASTAGTPQHQNTFNGLKNSGSCGTRRNGPYRFAIGSFIGYFYNGEIAEVVCHNRQLDANEFARLETYLAVKYGVTLGNNTTPVDYLSANSTILWNGSNLYQKRITVIGRDDASALLQKQSRSVHDGSMVTVYNRDTYTGVFPSMNIDNTNSFSDDSSFFAFGDDGQDTLVNQCLPGGRFARMLRTWKVQVTGNAGMVTLALQQSAIPPQTTALLVSTDPTFNTGVTIIPLQTNGTNRYAPYRFSNGQYFTFGTLPMSLNGITSPPVCDGKKDGYITLEPSGGAPPATFQWNTNPPQNSEDLIDLSPGSYTVTVKQDNGCTFDSTMVVAANPPLAVNVTKVENTICTAVNGFINVTGLGGTPPWLFSLNGSPYESSGTFSNLATGSHIISVKDRYGCLADTSVVVGNSTYELIVDKSAGDAWCDAGGLGGFIELQVMLGTPPYKYFWREFPSISIGKVNNIPKGMYSAMVTDENGCSGNISIDIDETPCCSIGLPNAFSPNGDGLNDEFLPAISQSFTNYYLSIFNRWGELVFQTNSVTKGWNGTINGKACEAGTYFYHISYACKMDRKVVEKRGDIVIIR